MNESSAYKWLKDAICNSSSDRIDRFENIVGVGNPDVNVCIDGAEFWIEIKAPKEPVKATTPLFGSNHKLSQDQKNWILRQLKANGNAYIFVATDKRKMLVHGKHADQFNEMTVSEMMTGSMWCAVGRASSEEKQDLRNALIAGF